MALVSRRGRSAGGGGGGILGESETCQSANLSKATTSETHPESEAEAGRDIYKQVVIRSCPL